MVVKDSKTKAEERAEAIESQVKAIMKKAVEIGDILDEKFVNFFKGKRFNLIVNDYYKTRSVLNNALQIADVALLKLENNMQDANDETISKKIYALASLNQSIVELSTSISELHDNYDKVIRNVLETDEDELETDGDGDNEEDDDALYGTKKK